MFAECNSLISLDFSKFNTESISNMRNMFWGCNKLKELKEIKNFNTEKVTNMMEMFYYCSSLEKLDL